MRTHSHANTQAQSAHVASHSELLTESVHVGDTLLILAGLQLLDVTYKL
jgi:hypothetical protein